MNKLIIWVIILLVIIGGAFFLLRGGEDSDANDSNSIDADNQDNSGVADSGYNSLESDEEVFDAMDENIDYID